MTTRLLLPRRRLCAAIALGAILTAFTTPVMAQSSLAAHIAPDRLRAGTDSFVVLVQGVTRGWQRTTVARVGDGWRLTDAVTIDSMVSQSSEVLLGADLSERSLRQAGQMRGREMRITLDWTGPRVRGEARTPASGPSGVITFDTTVATGTLDDNAVTPLLAAVRWTEGLTITFPVLASGRGTVSLQQVRVLGQEAVTVPAGTFDTWRVEMSRLVVNVTRQAPYRIVRMQGGPALEMQLVNPVRD